MYDATWTNKLFFSYISLSHLIISMSKYAYIIMMTDRLSNTIKTCQLNNLFFEFIITIYYSFLKLTSFMQASLYGTRFVVNKWNRKNLYFSALTSKLNTGLINKSLERLIQFVFCLWILMCSWRFFEFQTLALRGSRRCFSQFKNNY